MAVCRIYVVRRENERLQQELQELCKKRAECEKKPETKEAPKRELKKDRRSIPGT